MSWTVERTVDMAVLSVSFRVLGTSSIDGLLGGHGGLCHLCCEQLLDMNVKVM